MRTILSDLKRSVFGRACAIAILITVIAMWVGVLNDLLGYYETYNREGVMFLDLADMLTIRTLTSDAVLLCVPIIAAIPFTTALVDDVKSGFIKHYLTRSKFSTYVISKIIACAVAGGLALCVGIIIGQFTISLAAAPIEQAPVTVVNEDEMMGDEMMGDEMYFEFIEEPEPLFGVKNVIPFFLSGMLWALVGMLMSTVMMNKYMAYASPFILYYVLVILAERYFRSIYVLNPQNYLTLTGAWDLGVKSVYITLGLFIIGISLIFYIIAQRRLRA